jgi:hypothetical protein
MFLELYKNPFIYKLLALCVAACALVSLSACSGKKNVIVDFTGNVSIARGGIEIPVKNGIKIKNKDSIKAGEAGNCRLRLDEYKTVLLGGFGSMDIINLKKNFLLGLEPGVLLARIEKPLKKGESFEISLKNLTVSVRDMAVFSIHSSSEDDISLNVFQGGVTVCGKDGIELITLIKGQGVHANGKEGILKDQPGPVDFKSLPQIIADNVQDYANNEVAAGKDTISLQPAGPPTGGPEPETQDMPAAATVAVIAGADEETLQLEPPTAGQPVGAKVLPETPAAPIITFKYMWNGGEFKPYADISWPTQQANYILWQICESRSGGILASGRFEGGANGIELFDTLIDISPPGNNGLYPMGYTIRLTPYYLTSLGSGSLPMPPAVMALPYFEVGSEQNGSQMVSNISTNIGLYFNHSLERLEQSVENGRIRVKGSLLPLEGERIPLEIDILS